MRNDPDLLSVALDSPCVSQDHQSSILQYAGREAIVGAVGQKPGILKYVSEAMRDDRDIVMNAVGRHPMSYRFAGAQLKEDREIIIRAVSGDERVFRDLSLEQQRDLDLLREVVAVNIKCLQYINSRDIVIEEVGKDESCVEYLSQDLQADSEVITMAVNKDGCLLRYAGATLRNNEEVVLVALRQNGLALQYASDNLRADRAVVLAAIGSNHEAVQFASEGLRSDLDIQRACFMSGQDVTDDMMVSALNLPDDSYYRLLAECYYYKKIGLLNWWSQGNRLRLDEQECAITIEPIQCLVKIVGDPTPSCYEFHAVVRWLWRNSTNPMTRGPIQLIRGQNQNAARFGNIINGALSYEVLAGPITLMRSVWSNELSIGKMRGNKEYALQSDAEMGDHEYRTPSALLSNRA